MKAALRLALALFVLAFPGLSFALAGTFPDQGAAYAACQADWSGATADTTLPYPMWHSSHSGNKQCVRDGTKNRYICMVVMKTSGYYSYGMSCEKAMGAPTDNRYYVWPAGTDCSTRETETGWAVDNDPATSDDRCNNGCMMTVSLDLNTQAHRWDPTGSVCTNGDLQPPAPDADSDGAPDDEDAFPDNPNESQDTDGDGIGDNADSAPDDADNGADDGTGDESDNQAGGGGTCQAPPSCSGDGIACASLFQQWRTRCAIEGLSNQLGNGDGGGTGNGDGEGEGDDAAEYNGPDADEDPQGANRGTLGLGTNRIDESGFWSSRACPTLPVIPLGIFGSFDPNSLAWFCDFVTIVRGVLILLGAFIALRILMGD